MPGREGIGLDIDRSVHYSIIEYNTGRVFLVAGQEVIKYFNYNNDHPCRCLDMTRLGGGKLHFHLE